jgi:YVTN family beta-propeller protein
LESVTVNRPRILSLFAAFATLAVVVAACETGDAVEEAEPATDSGLFPGQTVDLHDSYVARTNTVQSVGAPLPEDGERWSGHGWVFVANEVGRGLTVLDLRTLEPVEFIYSENSAVPHHPYLSPDQRWVITNARFGNEVMITDTHNDFETDFLEFPEGEDDVAGPLHGTYTHDGRYFIVSLQRSGRVGVIDMETDGGPEILEVLDIGDRPRDVYITPDDAKAFISMQGEDTVGVLEIGTWEIRHIDRTEADYSNAGGGGGGMSVDGELFSISNTPEDEVLIIDADTEEVVHRVAGVPAPVNSEFLGDTHIVGTGNRSDGSASFIDADTGELLATVETGGGANIPYLGPDGNYWVSHNGDQHLSVLDPETFEILEEIRTGVNPHWIHFLPSGTRALVTNWGEDSISVIDTVNYRQLTKATTGLNPNGIVVKTDVTRQDAAAALDRGLDEARHNVELAAEMVLPEPDDRQEEIFLNNCAQCHDLGRVVRNNASSEEAWNEIVLRMVGNGAQLNEEEIDEVVAYLTEGRQDDLDSGTRLDERHGRLESAEEAPEVEEPAEIEDAAASAR